MLDDVHFLTLLRARLHHLDRFLSGSRCRLDKHADPQTQSSSRSLSCAESWQTTHHVMSCILPRTADKRVAAGHTATPDHLARRKEADDKVLQYAAAHRSHTEAVPSDALARLYAKRSLLRL